MEVGVQEWREQRQEKQLKKLKKQNMVLSPMIDRALRARYRRLIRK